MAEPSMLTLDVFSVFMCKECKTILAEGRSACEFNEALNVIAFLSATVHVEVEEKKSYDISPHLQGCVYSSLKCRVCTTTVGMFLTCAVAEVSHLKKLFCFFVKSVLCYSMKTKKMHEGNQFHFNVASCVTQLRELEQDLVDTFKRVQDLYDLLQHHQHSLLGDDC